MGFGGEEVLEPAAVAEGGVGLHGFAGEARGLEVMGQSFEERGCAEFRKGDDFVG